MHFLHIKNHFVGKLFKCSMFITHVLKCDLCKYWKSISIWIRLNRVNLYRPHTAALQSRHFGMHHHSLIAAVPKTLTPSCFAFGARSSISAKQIQWVQRTQQTSSMHQIVQCPFQNRNQSYLCSLWLAWYFDHLRFHIWIKFKKKMKKLVRIHNATRVLLVSRKTLTMGISALYHCTS